MSERDIIHLIPEPAHGIIEGFRNGLEGQYSYLYNGYLEKLIQRMQYFEPKSNLAGKQSFAHPNEDEYIEYIMFSQEEPRINWALMVKEGEKNYIQWIEFALKNRATFFVIEQMPYVIRGDEVIRGFDEAIRIEINGSEISSKKGDNEIDSKDALRQLVPVI